jgi:hypothetical protein
MYNRIPVELDAKITLNGNKYCGIIRNLSIGGILVSTNSKIKVLPNEKVEIKYKMSSKKTLHLYCRVKWFATYDDLHDFKFSMGLEIINPPAIYKDFLHSIFKSSFVFAG